MFGVVLFQVAAKQLNIIQEVLFEARIHESEGCSDGRTQRSRFYKAIKVFKVEAKVSFFTTVARLTVESVHLCLNWLIFDLYSISCSK